MVYPLAHTLYKIRTAILIAVLSLCGSLTLHAQVSDKDRLGMALEYFQGGKYHEAMLLLSQLDSKYRLNPRFKAYLGVCYYYEWQYAEATALLDSVIPKLQAFAPQELSFYCYADAESHFMLRHYDQALPLYQRMIHLCRDNEKPDAYYRMGFIYMYREEWIHALDHFQSALVYYQRFREDQAARIAQLKMMIKGCCEKIESEQKNKAKKQPQ